MTPDSELRNVVASWIATKKHACKDGPEDLNPQLDILYADGTRGLALIAGPRELLTPAIAEMKSGGEIVRIFHLADVYMRTGLPKDFDIDNSRFALSDAFQAGDMKVGEALTISDYDAQGACAGYAIVRYTIDDRGHPRFGQPDFLDAFDMGGVIPEIIAEALGGSHGS
jgi:hypothetical protein